MVYTNGAGEESAACEVIIPWRGGCAARETARAWVESWYGAQHPSWRVTVAEAPPGPWVKALAVSPAVEACPPGGIVVIADADIFCDGICEVVQAVADGAAWAVPHRLVHRLSEDATRNVLSGRPDDRCEQEPYQGILGGGVVVARREVFQEVPFDGRFVGWGQEDDSLAIALTCLYGEPWRGTADLWHLWHPPQQRMTRTRGTMDGWLLRRRYIRASADPAVMRELIEEARLPADGAATISDPRAA